MTPCGVLLDCFRAALDADDARRCVRESLQLRPLPAREWQVDANGKTAGAMAQDATDGIGARVDVLVNNAGVTRDEEARVLSLLPCATSRPGLQDGRSKGRRTPAQTDERPGN